MATDTLWSLSLACKQYISYFTLNITENNWKMHLKKVKKSIPKIIHIYVITRCTLQKKKKSDMKLSNNNNFSLKKEILLVWNHAYKKETSLSKESIRLS